MAYGLKPVKHLKGGLMRAQAYPIANNYNTALYTGDPVKLVTGGTIEIAEPASTTANIGVFWGVSYTASDGTPVFSKVWNTPSNATNIRAFVWDDPDLVFMVQADQVGTALDQAAVGACIDLSSGSGSALTGLSAWFLDSSGSPGSSTAQVKILGAANGDFQWTAVGTAMDVLVMFNEHIFSSTSGI